MYNTVRTTINNSLGKFSKCYLLPFLENLGVAPKRSFSENFNVPRSVTVTTMAENKFLLFPKLASTSNPSLIYIRCLANDLKIIKRNFSTSQCERKEVSEEDLTGKNFNLTKSEDPKIASSRPYFLKEHAYNKNRLAFSLKQLKERQPNSGLKLRYASERSDFGKHEARIFGNTSVNKANYSHNILNFIKEDLLDIRTIKDKIKSRRKEAPKVADEPEGIPVVKAPESKPVPVSTSSAVLVVPEKLPAVQTNSLEDALMIARKV